MSYTDQAKRQKPMSMAAAIAINGSIIAAVILSPMVVNPPKEKTRTTAIDIRPHKPPPKPADDEKVEIRKLDPIFVPDPPFDHRAKDDPIQITQDPPIFDPGPVAGKGDAPEFTEIVKTPPPPLFSKAKRDSRYARDFQPNYPSALLVREIEGSATIRVLVGTDGRVREAIVVSATHPDFGKSAVHQALKYWRFKPATRGDQTVEDWVTIPISFKIT